MQKIPPPVRFVAIVAALVLIFGACGSLTVGALDKVQTHTPGSLLDPTVLTGNVWHFLQETLRSVTTATDRNNVPLRNYFLQGLGLTVEFCFISMPLAIIAGLILALMSRSFATRRCWYRCWRSTGDYSSCPHNCSIPERLAWRRWCSTMPPTSARTCVPGWRW